MIIRYAGKLWDVRLEDDGTLDTVISVQPVAPKKRYKNAPNDTEYWPRVDSRFDLEYASQFRRKDGVLTLKGFRVLALDAIESYTEDLE